MAHSAKIIPFRPAQIRPIVITKTKIVKPKKHHKHHRSGGVGGLLGGSRGHMVMGAFAVGLIEKSGLAASLPKIPLIGETGTIGLAAHFLGGKSKLAQDIATAAFTIAAYQLGSTGAIVGEDGTVGGYVTGM